MKRDIHITARADFLSGGSEVAVFINDAPVVGFTVGEPGTYLQQPLMGGNEGHQFLQTALEAAWRLGLRPAGYEDHALELKATNRHLEDMRKITFKQLDVPDF